MPVSKTLKQLKVRPFVPFSPNGHAPERTFNPSQWSSRCPVLILSVAGFCVASYLAFYQWGIFKTVWEPFFGNGSRVVLHSAISRLLPMPDAFLGAVGYAADFATGLIGGSARWRTMPRMVLIYGITVAIVGAAGLLLAILQPLLFHAGCTLCLASTIISIVIVWLAKDEVIVGICYLREGSAAGPRVLTFLK